MGPAIPIWPKKYLAIGDLWGDSMKIEYVRILVELHTMMGSIVRLISLLNSTTEFKRNGFHKDGRMSDPPVKAKVW